MKNKKEIIIVTGLSGAGKHQVLYQLEDLGYFCVDNLPSPLLIETLDLLLKEKDRYPFLAIGIDGRAQIYLKDLKLALNQLKKRKVKYDIIFLEAQEEELVRRFSESRRPHPVRHKKTLSEGIRSETKQLAWLRSSANYVIDTTSLTPPELRRRLSKWVSQGQTEFQITVSSFGFKHGVPRDADMVFDMRFLPNPFYNPELRKLTGRHEKVKEFIFEHPLATETINTINTLIRGIINGFQSEGKMHLHVAIGCTGGQHRSVVMSEELKRLLPGKIILQHRELNGKGQLL